MKLQTLRRCRARLAGLACMALAGCSLHAADWVAAPSGLVGWWPGEGDARDIVGHNDGLLRGGATADAPAKVGTGFTFDGTNRYVEIPNAPELNPSELTVECWVRFDNLDAPGTSVYIGQQYLVFKQNTRNTSFEGYVLSKDRTHADIILWEVTSSSGKLVRIDSVSPVTTNQWYHLVGVRGPNDIRLYFNGKLEAQAAVDFPQNYGNYPLYFGTSGQAFYDRKLNGVLDEVSLYNRALTATEVAGLYAAGSKGKGWPAQVTITGSGSVSPNYDRRTLKPGVTYRMTAYPGPGYVFSNWTGSVVSTSRTVAFIGQNGLVLQANFVPNPFKPVAGTYRGLCQDAAGVAYESAGAVSIQLVSQGSFTGLLRLAGQSRSFSGKFDLEGRAELSFPWSGGPPLTLRLHLDLHGGTDRVTGTVSNGTWNSELVADRQVYSSTGVPCPQAGRYTLALAGAADSAVAAGGTGIATMVVNRAGVVSLSGVLGDGVSYTRSAVVAKSGSWPLYVPLYQGAGLLFGWIGFEDKLESDLAGEVTWSRPPLSTATYYRAGFVLNTEAQGSRYQRPAAGERILSLTNGLVELGGGNLAAPFSQGLTLKTNNQVSGTNRLSLGFNLTYGSFQGSAVNPATGKARGFKGVVLQKPNLGAGYHRGTNQTGYLLLSP